MIDETLAAIRPADEGAARAARELQARLTKPAGSLGQLEDLSVRLAALAGTCPPPMPTPGAVGGFHEAYRIGVTSFFGADNDHAVGAAIKR